MRVGPGEYIRVVRLSSNLRVNEILDSYELLVLARVRWPGIRMHGCRHGHGWQASLLTGQARTLSLAQGTRFDATLSVTPCQCQWLWVKFRKCAAVTADSRHQEAML